MARQLRKGRLAWWSASSPGFCGGSGTIAARSPAFGGQHAVKADQMQARARHQRGQAPHEFQCQAVREVRPKQIARMRALAKQWLVMSARPTILS